MIFDALGSLALGEIPIEAVVPPVVVPVTEPIRISGGKLIAAYTMDDNGRLRRKIDALIEMEMLQAAEDDEMIAALLAYWRL